MVPGAVRAIPNVVYVCAVCAVLAYAIGTVAFFSYYGRVQSGDLGQLGAVDYNNDSIVWDNELPELPRSYPPRPQAGMHMV